MCIRDRDPPDWRLRRTRGASRGGPGGAVAPPERPLAPEAPAGGVRGVVASPLPHCEGTASIRS
eukprot:3811254-Alexandrium_andersonii.AAC.1